MVKSTIDDIKDITLERQIRKLAGVIDKQNEVIGGVGDVDARLTAVEDSTANNTVQINSVKVDVAKNTTAIENISNRVTNVEQSTEAIPGIQTEIDGINKSLVSGVTATFDNPSRELKISVERQASPSIDATVVIPASSETGQYSAGNGITIQDYQIAVDTNVVALKTDIPVVPDVTSLTQRVTTLETEMPTKASVDSVNALEATVNSNTENITNLTNKNTEQDTAINGKVAIAQGTENAGKVLGIGSDGNVTPVNAGGSSAGGEVWEEVDLSNWPTDWKTGDRFKISFKVNLINTEPYLREDTNKRASQFIETEIRDINVQQAIRAEILRASPTDFILFFTYEPTNFNDSSGNKTLFSLSAYHSGKSGSTSINRGNISTYIYKVYRLK